MNSPTSEDSRNGLEVAIVGMAGRFPGARNINEFWRNLAAGVESIEFFSDEELQASGVEPKLFQAPDYVRARGMLAEADLFDASFFGYSPREAEITDPQHRIFLECAWEALEDAGYDPRRYPGPIGVYGGVKMSTYMWNVVGHPEVVDSAGPQQILLGNDKDFLVTRVAYKLDLKGPGVNVQTACSTSLVAVHLACQALLGGECDMALAGGVALSVPQRSGYLYQENGILSRDGRCRAFDRDASGSVPGEGVGIVVLKRLESALEDGDSIYAVIRGSGVNNDGVARAGFTAPSVEGQAKAIRAAHLISEVEPESIAYVETHGTATRVGDPIEIAALTRAFRAATSKKGFCALGSVKTNIGHLDTAAGIAGLIKTVLALKNRQIPPSLHYERPNPEIDFDDSPFYVARQLSEWPAVSTPRRAGVSSFGLGGTNAHAVLEEAPPEPSSVAALPWQLLAISARTESALESMTDDLAEHLRAHPEVELADVAYTCQVGRRPFEHRRIVVARDTADTAEVLASRDPGRLLTGRPAAQDPAVAFAFSGLGDHYVGMGLGVYETFPSFAREVDCCSKLLEPFLGVDLKEVLYPELGSKAPSGTDRSEGPRSSSGKGLDLRKMLGRDTGQKDDATRRLGQTRLAHPALFVLEYALARLWIELGIRPAALIGYSLGEYVAACVAGVLSVEDALTLVAERARLIDELPNGAMLAVPLSEEKARAYFGEDLWLAAVNGPELVVVAGPLERISELEGRLAEEELLCRRLETSHAFHSGMMREIAPSFRQLLESLELKPPEIPILSNVTGTVMTAEEATDPEYWVRHLIGTVRFGDGAAELWREPGRVLLEIGPGQSLGSLALQVPSSEEGTSPRPAFATLPHGYDPQPDLAFLLRTVGQLFLAGLQPQWPALYPEGRRRVHLPSYPFERQRFWLDRRRMVFESSDSSGTASKSSEEIPPKVIEKQGTVESDLEPTEVKTPLYERPTLSTTFVESRDEVEERVAGYWQEILGIRKIGVYDNFFELGGHSLAGARLFARLQRDFGIELPLQVLFETPTVAGLAEILGERREETSGKSAAPRIQPVSRQLDLPLSFSQERLWFLDQLLPGRSTYNVRYATRLKGPLNVRALRGSVDEIARRQESLRTTFKNVEGRPLQFVDPDCRQNVPVVDLRELPRDVREREARRRALEESGRPFDLVRGPLLRVTLLQLDEREYIIVAIMHHIISDGWSMHVFFYELAVTYGALSKRLPHQLPKPAIQYADYAYWQRRELGDEHLDETMSYWREQLAGAPQVLNLPTDRPRPAVLTFEGGMVAISFPHELRAGLQALSRKQNVTPFTTLLAAYNVLISRYSGDEDVVVGSPTAGRTEVETEDLIGFFVNMLVLRSELSGGPTFVELMDQVSRCTLLAQAHQDVPFEKLVEELQPDRNLSHTPLFQTSFVIQNVPKKRLEFPGFDLGVVGIFNDTTKFDVTVQIEGFESPDTIESKSIGFFALVEYNSNLFDSSTVRRMMSHYRTLLEGLVADPRARASEVALLTPAERSQVLWEWNDKAIDCPQTPLVHELFAEHARRSPEALALVWETGRLTYGELDARSNRLAHHLRTSGVGPEVTVATFVDRTTPERVVGIVAALKAGGAYLSVDPTHPRDRIAFLMTDARAPVVLTEERYLELLPPLEAEIVCLDRDWDSIMGDERRPPETGVEPENLAYVVYTSGSTGQPKGVATPHAGLMNLVRWHQREYSVTAADRGTQVASPAFDASVWELWPYLAAGASLAIPNDETRLSSPDMIRWWADQGITLAYLMTPLAEGVLNEKVPEGLDLRVRALIIGGDRLHRRPDPKAGFRLMNHYGPAEYSVTCTAGAVPAEPAGSKEARSTALDAIPSVGRTLDNTQILILDRNLEPAPAGVPGELFVGGVGLARCYLQRPILTAEKFVPHMISSEPGARLYRTGDLLRWLPDGDMDFLRRMDHQVKLRGFRIELGEIESALDEHPALNEAAVVLWEDPPQAGVTPRKLLAGYLVPHGEAPSEEDVRGFLKDRLPTYMIPTAFVFLEALPLSPNGKVDRRALPAPESALESSFVAPESEIEARVAEIWSELLGMERVGVEDTFFDLGGHSLLMVRLQHRLRESFGVDLSIVDLFQYPTVQAMAGHLEALTSDSASGRTPTLVTRSEHRSRALARRPGDIAIVGMSVRFPGARDVDELWRNLKDGVESIVHFTEMELVEAGIPVEILRDPHYVKASGELDGADLFDAGFFGYSPREAQIMDPQHRLFLQTAFHGLEDAGYGSDDGRGTIGVFAGTSISTYLVNLYSNPTLMASLGGAHIMTSNDKDQLSTRVSYKLNLKGPSLSVQSACSTSMVATHMACQSLMMGECDMALAGGVSVRVPLKSGYRYSIEGISSPDGHCRVFDAAAGGTVGGDGVGVVVLKRLEEALEAGDSIYAVIKGTAINNDGALKAGFTAPGVDGQAAVILEAQEMAGVHPESIGYVEAHGTGTRLGDPIEIAALTQAFRRRTTKKQFCAIGSIKSNMGHLDAAAGVAGLIKATLAVSHGEIPPSLHFETPNPEIAFDDSPVFVNTRLAPWPMNSGPRRAGVSSFGIGGTNVHAILEEAPRQPTPPPKASAKPWQLVVLSARSEEALDRATANLAEHLRRFPELELADVAYTQQVGRKAFEHRRVVVAADTGSACRELQGQGGQLLTGRRMAARPSSAFLFPGLGDHYSGMGQGLYETEPVFREALDECARLLESELGLDLRKVLFAKPRASGRTAAPEGKLDFRALVGRNAGDQAEGEKDPLHPTLLAQPATFAVEYALARLWMGWGIKPQAMLGYSLGEYVAACLAGVFTLGDALTLVSRRARMIDGLPEGAMLAVPLSEDEIEPYLDRLSLSAVNGPKLCVLGGAPEDVIACEKRLDSAGFDSRRLVTLHAFHSKMMDSIAVPFRELVRTVKLRRPRLPYLSNVTGKYIEDTEATDPDYWVEHLCRPVRFADGIGELWRDPQRILLEVGPGQALGSLALQHPAGGVADRLTVASLPNRHDPQADSSFLLRSLGRLWLAGVEVDWSGLHADRRRRIHLPGYSFEHRRDWVETAERSQVPDSRRRPVAESTYLPRWREGLPAALLKVSERRGRWLLFADETGMGDELARRLLDRGATITSVRTGSAFEKDSPGAFRIDPKAADHYHSLLRALEDDDARPDRIVHLWSLSENACDFNETQDKGYFSLLYLAQALARLDEGKAEPRPLELAVVTESLFAVRGDESTRPSGATALGPVKVIPHEIPHVAARLVDLTRADGLHHQSELLFSELTSAVETDLVALRDRRRWERHFEPTALPPASEGRPALLMEGGAYLLTGGLGGLGLTLAHYLSERARANLIFLSATGLPDRSEWPRILRRNEQKATTQRIRILTELEKMGSAVLVLKADVSDREAVELATAEARERFGRIHGVFHLAAIPGDGLMRSRSREAAERVLAVKATGARILTEVFQDEELDFMVLYSSIDSLTGAVGQSDYCAANAYLDALASGTPVSPFPILTINWDVWKQIGMGARAEVRYRSRFLGDGIRLEEADELFDRLLNHRLPQIAVSMSDLPQRFAESREGSGPALPSMESPYSEAHPRPALHTQYVAPRSSEEREMAEHWQDLLGIDQVGIEDNFFELGGHSLMALQVVSHVHKSYGVEIPMQLVFESPTVAALVEALGDKAERSQEEPSPIVPLQPLGDLSPFFFVHPAGGFVSEYSHLARLLGTERPFYGLQAQGTETDEVPHDRIEEMASSYVAAVREAQPQGPYFLGGWSFGGIVAFEMARQMAADKDRIALMVVGDIAAPGEHHWTREGPGSDADIVTFFARENGLEIDQEELSKVPPEEHADYITQLAIREGFLSEGGDRYIRRFLRVFRAAHDAGRAYAPELCDVEITLLRTDDETVETGMVPGSLGPDIGWHLYSSKDVRIVKIPGRHINAVAPPHAEVMAERLRELLEEAQLRTQLVGHEV